MNLWPIPVYMQELAPNIANVKEFAPKQEYFNTANNAGWVTRNRYILEDPALKPLKSAIMQQVEIFARHILSIDYKVRFEFTQSWIIKHPPGTMGMKHCHENAVLSGIYYVTVPEKGGTLWFHKDKHVNVFYDNMRPEYMMGNSYNEKHLEIRPRDGMFLLFPSHLMHSVGINNDENLRFSLPFNLHMKGPMGSYETLNKLDVDVSSPPEYEPPKTNHPGWVKKEDE